MVPRLDVGVPVERETAAAWCGRRQLKRAVGVIGVGRAFGSHDPVTLHVLEVGKEASEIWVRVCQREREREREREEEKCQRESTNTRDAKRLTCWALIKERWQFGFEICYARSIIQPAVPHCLLY